MLRSSSIKAEEYVFPSLQALVDEVPVMTYGPEFCTGSPRQIIVADSAIAELVRIPRQDHQVSGSIGGGQKTV